MFIRIFMRYLFCGLYMMYDLDVRYEGGKVDVVFG